MTGRHVAWFSSLGSGWRGLASLVRGEAIRPTTRRRWTAPPGGGESSFRRQPSRIARRQPDTGDQWDPRARSTSLVRVGASRDALRYGKPASQRVRRANGGDARRQRRAVRSPCPTASPSVVASPRCRCPGADTDACLRSRSVPLSSPDCAKTVAAQGFSRCLVRWVSAGPSALDHRVWP